MTVSLAVDADILSDALAPVSTIVDEAIVTATEDGLRVRAVDAANVAMVDMELDAGACASYQADGQELGLDLDRLESVIGMADSGDVVHIELDEETNKLDIGFGGLSFTMALLDVDSIRQRPDIPELDLPGTFVVEGRDIGRAITAADLCSDHIAIEAVDESLCRVEAEGDTDDVVVRFDGEDLLSGQFEGDEAGRSLFSLEYLAEMSGPIGSDTPVSLLVGQEKPLKLKYSRADGDCSVLHMLAPRIQQEGA
jgi:proliferating cell nuclear antigen